LIADAGSIDPVWLEGKSNIGLTAGASAPEELVLGVIDRLRQFDEVEVVPMQGVEETIEFRLPPGLRSDSDDSEAA
jgi:4-hydroxy-3-methylbut-2-enyl diphosphate reductase